MSVCGEDRCCLCCVNSVLFVLEYCERDKGRKYGGCWNKKSERDRRFLIIKNKNKIKYL